MCFVCLFVRLFAVTQNAPNRKVVAKHPVLELPPAHFSDVLGSGRKGHIDRVLHVLDDELRQVFDAAVALWLVPDFLDLVLQHRLAFLGQRTLGHVVRVTAEKGASKY